jgi:integrase
LPTDLVFSHPDGRPLRPNSVTRALKRTGESGGLKGIRLHDLRHAHASILLKQGVHPKIVQERLGHSSISTTLDIYSHLLPGLDEAAARRFEEGLQGVSYEVAVENVAKMSPNLPKKEDLG